MVAVFINPKSIKDCAQLSVFQARKQFPNAGLQPYTQCKQVSVASRIQMGAEGAKKYLLAKDIFELGRKTYTYTKTFGFQNPLRFAKYYSKSFRWGSVFAGAGLDAISGGARAYEENRGKVPNKELWKRVGIEAGKEAVKGQTPGAAGAVIGAFIGGIAGGVFGVGVGAIPGAIVGAKVGYMVGSIAGGLYEIPFVKKQVDKAWGHVKEQKKEIAVGAAKAVAGAAIGVLGLPAAPLISSALVSRLVPKFLK